MVPPLPVYIGNQFCSDWLQHSPMCLQEPGPAALAFAYPAVWHACDQPCLNSGPLPPCKIQILHHDTLRICACTMDTSA